MAKRLIVFMHASVNLKGMWITGRLNDGTWGYSPHWQCSMKTVLPNAPAHEVRLNKGYPGKMRKVGYLIPLEDDDE